MALMNMLRHRCSIYRYTTTDHRGFPRDEPNLIAQDVPCSVQPTPAIRQIEFGNLGVKLTHTIYMARDLAINDDKSKVMIHWNGRNYMVRNISNTTMVDWPTTVDVEEIPGELDGVS